MRKIIFILLSILIVGAALYFYFDTVFVPVQFKQYLITKSEKYLNRKVTISKIDFTLLKGFVIDGIQVSRRDDPGKALVKIDQVGFNLMLAPFIRKSAVIIPEIKLVNPAVYAARDKDGRWNFADLIKLRGEAEHRKLPAILMRKMTVENGEVTFKDQSQKQEFSELITNINVHATLSLNKGIRLIAAAHAPKHKAALRLKGNYVPKTGTATAQVILNNIPLAHYWPLLSDGEEAFRMNSGQLTLADLTLTYQNGEVLIRGDWQIDGTDLDFGPSRNFSGSVSASNMLVGRRADRWDAKGQLSAPSFVWTESPSRNFLGELTLDVGVVTFRDNTVSANGTLVLDKARLNFDDNTRLSGNFRADGAQFSKTGKALTVAADLTADDMLLLLKDGRSLRGNIKTEGTDLIWSAVDEEIGNRLNIQGPVLLDKAEIMIDEETTLEGRIEATKAGIIYGPGGLTVESQGQFHKTLLRIKDGRELSGSPHFNVTYRDNAEGLAPPEYKGSLHFSDGTLAGLPYIGEAGQIEGIITFSPKYVQTEKLTFAAGDTAIQLSGELTDFKDPVLNATFISNGVRLGNIMAAYPALRETVNADITGNANLKGLYNGPLNKPDEATVTLTAQIADAAVDHDKLDGNITGITGWIDYERDLLKWSNFEGVYKDMPYKSSGRLTNFSRPAVETTLKSDELDVEAQIKLLNQAFQFSSLTGQYLNTRFDLKGDVHLHEDQDADIDLRGTFALDLADLERLVPRYAHKARELKPTGIIDGEGIYQGKLSDWRNWKVSLEATSGRIRVAGLALDNVEIRLGQRDLAVSRCELNADVYGGKLSGVSAIDLREPPVPFSASLHLDNADLQKFREDKKMKNSLLAGNLVFGMDVEGEIEHWRDMTGTSSLDITDGHIWQWNILKGIESLLLIPEFKSMAFTEAHANFTIGDGKFRTQNARMTGESIVLDGVGWVDFDRRINFNIKPTFSELAILKSKSSGKKGPTSIITQTKDYLNIKVTGTLDDPKHTVEKFPIKILEETIGGTTGTLKEVIGSIVDEIFE